MGKVYALTLILAVALFGVLLESMPFASSQTGTNVSYIISSDTAWTQAGSPYNFVGNVAVDSGATLTIQSGVSVNTNNHYLRVNGTLVIQPGAIINLGLIGDGIDVYGVLSATGTNANPIRINGAAQGHILFSAYSAVTFFPSSAGWNKQTSSGSLIENTIFNQTGLEMQSPIKVSDSTFLSGGITAESASPIIVNNYIASGLSVIQNPNTPGTIWNQGNGSSVIEPEIKNNTITGLGLALMAGGGIVEDNVISVGNGNPNSGYIGALSLNDGYGVAISTVIQRNLIKDSPIGVTFNVQYAQNNKATLRNNTVTNNTAGFQLGSLNVPTMTSNNIYGNSYNAKLAGVSSQVNLTNNWWGTTDQQAISQTIYDYKNDFNLGTVNFIPFLTAPNPQALPNPNAPIPTPNPATPTPTPTVPEFQGLAILSLFILVLSVALVVKRLEI